MPKIGFEMLDGPALVGHTFAKHSAATWTYTLCGHGGGLNVRFKCFTKALIRKLLYIDDDDCGGCAVHAMSKDRLGRKKKMHSC